jgi:hypothetical protein
MHALNLPPIGGVCVPTDFRKQILDRLAALGKNKLWLAEQVKPEPSQNAIYTYLRGRGDMTGEYIARIMDALDAAEEAQKK